MKRILIISMVLLSIFILGTAVSASEPVVTPKLYVNGMLVESDQPPVIEEGRTLVPLRPIFGALGGKVEWNQQKKTAYGELNNKSVTVVINSDTMHTGDSVIYLDVPAKIINGRTMIPARAVAEALGCKVDWDRTTKTVIITELYDANEKDREKLALLLGKLLPCMDDNQYYKYKPFSDDTANKSAGLVLGYSYPAVYEFYHGTSDLQMIKGQDPLKIFPANSYYFKLPQEKVDYIRRNVLNSMSDKTAFKNMHYLSNGYYYVCTSPTDFQEYSVTPTINKNKDGTYDIQASCYITKNGDRPLFVTSYRITASLIKIDEKSVWSFHSIENTKKVGVREPVSPDIVNIVKISEEQAKNIATAKAKERYPNDVNSIANISTQLRTSNGVTQYAVSFDLFLNSQVSSLTCIVAVDAISGEVLSFNIL